jgi:cytochrome c553
MKISAVYLLLLISIASCSHYDEIMKSGKESTYSSKSHNAGQNCMTCHNSGSDLSEAVREGGWWNVAGTVYGGNGKDIELWTGPNRTGELIHTLQIDRSGNFYSAKIIQFKTGVYPVLVKKDESTKEMSTSTLIGACNSCHGKTTDAIKTN